MENSENQIFLNEYNSCFLIDWLTVVIHGMKVDELQELLNLQGVEWETRACGINGYPMVSTFSHINIRWGADDPRFYTDSIRKDGTVKTAASKARTDMGICLDVSGQGCRAIEEFTGLSWYDLFDRLHLIPERINVTRLDLAFDDHDGCLDIHRMRMDVEDRNYVSKSRKAMVIWSDDQDTDIQGLTLQIGSRSSPVLIRIYDKAAERGWGKDKHWIRVELQLRQERSMETFNLLRDRQHLGMVASGIISNYLNFVVPSSDSNKSRWQVAWYWQAMLLTMEKLRIWIAPGEPYNFSKTENCLIHQFGQALIAYSKMHSGSINGLLFDASRIHTELKPKYVRAVSEALLREQKSPQPDRWIAWYDPTAEEFGGNFKEFGQLFLDLPEGW